MLLFLLLVVSTAGRALWLNNPDHILSDEIYYTSAARHIAGLPPGEYDYYSEVPGRTDPNTEHPPLAKVIMAASMRALGDNPLGWRVPSVVFGTLAVAGLYFLARSARAGPGVALAAAALMCLDNLFYIHGRVGTLDIFAIAFMLFAVGFYLRHKPVVAGTLLGVGATTKLVALVALGMIGVVEGLRWAQHRRSLRESGRDNEHHPPARRHDLAALGACVVVTAITYLGVLAVLDQAFTKFPDPIAHTKRMVTYAGSATFQAEGQSRALSTPGFLAPVSRPWDWLANHNAYDWAREASGPPGQPGANRVRIHFQARMNPFILWLAVPAFLAAAYGAWARGDDVANLAAAWFGLTFAMFVFLALRERVSYLYYMVMVLPGVYLGVAHMLARLRLPTVARAGYGLAVIVGFAAMFPFRTWGGN